MNQKKVLIIKLSCITFIILLLFSLSFYSLFKNESEKLIENNNEVTMIKKNRLESVIEENKLKSKKFFDKKLEEGNYNIIVVSDECSDCINDIVSLEEKYPNDNKKNIYIDAHSKETKNKIKKYFDITDIFDSTREFPFVINIDIKNNENNQYVLKGVKNIKF